ncbi:hypothetical protein ZWY2020_039294 [Hordeum vulgare]|nr:hypothetical protein ZWY2020_039294 [Hordeum vulgare]
MQTQRFLQMVEKAEKEHKKMVDKVSHVSEFRVDLDHEIVIQLLVWITLHASYKKLVVTLPDMAKSVARAIDGLCSRYNIPTTTA